MRHAKQTETYEERQRRAHQKGAARRSENTRKRTFAEVRATVHDASIQLNAFARQHKDRPDLRVVAALVSRIERWAVSEKPSTRAELLKFVETGLPDVVLRAWELPDGSTPGYKSGHPDMYAQVTHEGLRVLQAAVADRISAGLLPTEPPAPKSVDTIDFIAARDRLLSKRRDERTP